MRDPADEGRTHEMTLPGGSGARIGYARVSTPEQDISLQIDALERAGCSRIFQDVASGAKAERKGLDEALAYTAQNVINIGVSKTEAKKEESF